MGHQTRLSLLRVFSFFFCLMSTSCGGNVFQESSGQTTEDAIYIAVQKATNDGDFAKAVEIIDANPGVIPITREQKMIYGSALAGNCGVTFGGLVDVIGSGTITGTTFVYLMSAFSAVTTNASDCTRAQTLIESIGDVTSRTLSENLALFLLGFSKVGTYLKESADTAAPFGTVDPGFNACTTGALPTSDVKQMITGLSMMIETADELTAYIGNDLSTSLGSIETVCGDSCEETNADNLDDVGDAQVAADIVNVRRAIASNEFGVGACAIVTCCP